MNNFFLKRLKSNFKIFTRIKNTFYLIFNKYNIYYYFAVDLITYNIIIMIF